MADIPREDLGTLIQALRQGDQRGAAVESLGRGFQAGQKETADAELNRRKIALAAAIKQASQQYQSNVLSETTRHNKATEDIARMRAAEGANKPAGKVNELKSKSLLYLGQAKGAAAILDEPGLEDSLTGRMSRIDLPFTGTPERFKSEARKRFEGAARRFAAAVLRPETGAQANEQEIRDTQLRFIGQPGDSDKVKAEKRAARQTFMNLLDKVAKGDTDAAYQLDTLVATPTTLARAAATKAGTTGQPAAPVPSTQPAASGALTLTPSADLTQATDDDLMKMLLTD